jgi:hypothetical protein
MKQRLFLASFLLLAVDAFAQLDSGLVAKYYFNDGSANDGSGNGYDADTVTATITSDRWGNGDYAYSFDGNQFINVPHSSPFNVNDFSVSAWFRATNHDSTWQRIITLPVGGISGDQHFSVLYNSPLRPHEVMIYFDPGPGYSSSADTVNDDQWHHYVGTVNTSGMEIISYLDGIPKDTTSFGSAPTSASGSLQIGRFSNTYHQSFTGDIDDIRFYNRVLTEAEVTSLHDEPNPVLSSTPYTSLGSLALFPNPTAGVLNILSHSEQAIEFTFYNAMGTLLFETNTSQVTALDLTEFEPGIYFYAARSLSGQVELGRIVRL